MTLSSMTGFARKEGSDATASWVWEMRSVNARGLDMRFKLASGTERLEPKLRRQISGRFKRGNMSVTLTMVKRAGQTGFQVNQTLLDELLSLSRNLSAQTGLASGDVNTLLTARGVLEATDTEEDNAAIDAREAALLCDFEGAMNGLATARAEEGARIGVFLNRQIATITGLAQTATEAAECQPATLKERLQRQLTGILDIAENRVDEERLAQELALIATRADVREELDRLNAHIAAADDLLKRGGAVGRKLDFLCQEFNRESNTLCSKAQDVALTNTGLALKATIEQFREQVQNIE